MCGICGEVSRIDRPRPDINAVKLITTMLFHRGPDEEGFFLHKNIAFGHRRLSIIDIEKNHQPMLSDDKNVVCSYNGEIYNYVELKEELKSRGAVFHTSGDTEVLLAAYFEWGEAMLPKLNGMFAFAIYDFKNNKLFLGRDRFGQKPIVYYEDDSGVIFSSELKPLLTHPRIKKIISVNAAIKYLVFQNSIAPETIVEGVKKLPASSALTYNAATSEIKTFSYYDPAEDKQPRGHFGHILTHNGIDECEANIKSALLRHMRSDVPIGFYLSGGIDSTILSLLASELSKTKIKTFTVSHNDPTFDEGPLARRTADYLGSEHHEKKMTHGEYENDILGVLEKIDEPIADPGAIASFMVTKHASRFVKVVITGNGGDEFFYGYEPYLRLGLSRTASKAPRLAIEAARRLLSLFPESTGYMSLPFKTKIFLKGLEYPEYLRNTVWISAFSFDELIKTASHELKSNVQEAIADSYNIISAVYRNTEKMKPLKRLSIDFEKIYLPYSICAHTDKTSMMHSLEARSPFLDNELADYANNLPCSWKLHNGVSKFILRKIIERRLGRSPVTSGAKRGFTVPIARLLRETFKPIAQRYFEDDITHECGIFNPKAVKRLWREHSEGEKNHYRKLWSIFTLHNWIKRNIIG